MKYGKKRKQRDNKNASTKGRYFQNKMHWFMSKHVSQTASLHMNDCSLLMVMNALSCKIDTKSLILNITIKLRIKSR